LGSQFHNCHNCLHFLVSSSSSAFCFSLFHFSRLFHIHYLVNMAANTLRKRKIAVLGSRSVGVLILFSISSCLPAPHPTGKSSLVVQFIENHFVDAYYPTIESTFSKGVAYRGVEYDCDIIDTAGQVCILMHHCISRLICIDRTSTRFSILNTQLVFTVTSSYTRSPQDDPLT
jgi:hypothetical protein